MSGQWKPGDVGSHPRSGIGIVVKGSVVCDHGCGDEMHWHTQSGRWNLLDSDYRPLAVIDPEDAEQIERLAQAYISANPSVAAIPTLIAARLTAALREFAAPTPTRPDEPTGLGALVECVYANIYVYTGDGLWQRVGDIHRQPCKYADLDVVRVISEGVASA